MRRSYLSSPHGVRRFGIHERGAVAAPRGSRPDAAADAVEDGVSDRKHADRTTGAAPRTGGHDD
jgi:hypothetical protein